ncbi:immunoglobulin lambda-1 light chain-like isoform X2 [Hemitrygon akajei]|uniref:immunoglobulin lambda-1 light chain-like isoform X2 n=1 Tax=Hemitrygon akajei TaxID=2704970 RepID=UPI003BFA0F43
MFISLGWKLPRRNRCCSSALRVEKRKHGPKYRDANGAVHRFNQDLQQPGVLTVPKGNSILLNCSYSMPTLSKFQVSWTFSNDGSRTSKIIANKTSINFWVSHSRYCVRHNSTLKTFTLTITDVQVSDNGTYFCEVFGKIPPPNFRAQGNGTLLSVTARPSLCIFKSSNEIASLSSTITCLVYGFYPNSITWRILPTCLSERVINTSCLSNPNGTYNCTIIVSISSENCTNSTEFTCVIQHPASQTKINATILIEVHAGTEGYKWISILLSISGGTTCVILLLLSLRKCARERKKIQEQKRIQASNRTLDLGQNNMNENCKEEVCYAKLQWGTMQRARMHEEVVYSPVLH